MTEKDGARWWEKLLGKAPGVTDGERAISLSGDKNWLIAQEEIDARRLIEIGMRTKDEETINIGRARLRYLLGKHTPDDEDLFMK